MPIDPTEIKSECLYSVAEAAGLLKKKEQTIRLYLNDGTLKGNKNSKGKWTIPGKELNKFLGTINMADKYKK